MQFEITDQAALIFSNNFYSALAAGNPVDTALSEARLSIFTSGNDIEWGTPVLFTRFSDGRLFNIPVSYPIPRPVEPISTSRLSGNPPAVAQTLIKTPFSSPKVPEQPSTTPPQGVEKPSSASRAPGTINRCSLQPSKFPPFQGSQKPLVHHIKPLKYLSCPEQSKPTQVAALQSPQCPHSGATPKNLIKRVPFGLDPVRTVRLGYDYRERNRDRYLSSRFVSESSSTGYRNPNSARFAIRDR
jgi:hypothetical protein